MSQSKFLSAPRISGSVFGRLQHAVCLETRGLREAVLILTQQIDTVMNVPEFVTTPVPAATALHEPDNQFATPPWRSRFVRTNGAIAL